jgi:Mg/Co/Ni transporter MgtE
LETYYVVDAHDELPIRGNWVFIPLTLHKLGRDPVLGSSVMLTAVTDSMGFFIFLGLATVLLLQ